MKIHPVGAKLFLADGRMDRRADGRMDRWTDVMKLIVGFHNFVNVPKNSTSNLDLKPPILHADLDLVIAGSCDFSNGTICKGYKSRIRSQTCL
jgi:hypothetical protein